MKIYLTSAKKLDTSIIPSFKDANQVRLKWWWAKRGLKKFKA